MFVITTAALVLKLCAGMSTAESGFPDTGDGTGGAIAISGYTAIGINPNIHPRVGLMVKKENPPEFGRTFTFLSLSF